MDLPRDLDIFRLEDSLWMAVKRIGNPVYDFAFESFFACRRPYDRPDPVSAVARVGAPDDYGALFEQLRSVGIRLINSPAAHRLASELPLWYPGLRDLTVHSEWYDEIPSAAAVERRFGWPVFVKGSRQTARHDPGLAIARDAGEFTRLAQAYRHSPMLHWQQFCVREFVDLRPVPARGSPKIRPSFEFRTFWWQARLVGAGPYWQDFAGYDWSDAEREAGLQVAETAARRLDVPFLVLDIAQLADGPWILIECNDAQESGYAGVSPFGLWQSIVGIEKGGG